jgi:DNA-binding FadR family transcriptional regulator
MYHRLSQRAGLDRHQEAALVDHEAIFKAIAERNPNEARRAMRLHLYHVEEHLTSDEAGGKEEPMSAARGKRSSGKNDAADRDVITA